ncbi:hypothetical protein [Streptomyces marianii]|uniref:Transposase DDE domain-containing protein n=1 Tax=Streptomyces marianii TaxID=1817406 RepID=A0A5R9DWH8_9ACTN|nr:hypothetical protein [Streptomyces marianii]TLQ41920.1 hypothetical protein FEF34_00195 [Streptomyces marianii]
MGPALSVAADGKGLIGYAGAVLLRRLADRTGLTAALAAALPGAGGHGWRDRGAVLVQLAVAIVMGARNLSEAEALQAHHQGLFGPAVSDSTTRRALADLDEQALVRSHMDKRPPVFTGASTAKILIRVDGAGATHGLHEGPFLQRGDVGVREGGVDDDAAPGVDVLSDQASVTGRGGMGERPPSVSDHEIT